VVVEGRDAVGRVQSHFHAAAGKPLSQIARNRIVFGRWGDRRAGEEVIVCHTDENTVELHCHGGRAAAEAVLQQLAADGCDRVDWRRWVCQRDDDPFRGEALVALTAATTVRTARILLDQYLGALRHTLTQIVPLIDDDRPQAGMMLQRLAGWSTLGRHLTEPFRVVLAGPANAGKSSLINALVGFDRAIVHPRPGTTRDVVTAAAALDGWPMLFSDTAGLDRVDAAEPSDAQTRVEQAGIERARRHLAEVDLVVLVFDGAACWSADAAELTATHPDALIVHNKSDLPADEQPRPAGIAVSATTGDGVDRLAAEIVRRLVAEPPPAGEAVPFTPEHVRRIADARCALEAGDLGRARSTLRALLTRRPANDIPRTSL